MARRMKDSGVEWIGEIPEEWNTRKLKAVITCKDGERVPIDSGLRETGPYPYWGAGSITDHVNDYLFDEELVLLGEDGAPFFDRKRNVAFLIREKVWVNNHIHVLKADKEVISSYLVHFLNIVDFSCYINGSILNKLTQSNMNRINIVFPDKHDQKMIADFLDEKIGEIDSLIVNTKETIEDYRKYKQAIITDVVTKGLHPDVEMKESGIGGIGEIPQHWGKIALKKVSTKPISYGVIKLFNPDKNGVKILRCSDIKDGYIIEDGIRTITKELSDEYSRTILKTGDVVINVRGTLGGCAVIPESMNGYNIAREVALIAIDKEKYFSDYIMYCLLSKNFENFRDLSLSGCIYLGINMETLSKFICTLPPLEEQKEIAEYLDEKCFEIDKLIVKKEELLADLESYKKSLIYEYVTGKKQFK